MLFANHYWIRTSADFNFKCPAPYNWLALHVYTAALDQDARSGFMALKQMYFAILVVGWQLPFWHEYGSARHFHRARIFVIAQARSVKESADLL